MPFYDALMKDMPRCAPAAAICAHAVLTRRYARVRDARAMVLYAVVIVAVYARYAHARFTARRCCARCCDAPYCRVIYVAARSYCDALYVTRAAVTLIDAALDAATIFSLPPLRYALRRYDLPPLPPPLIFLLIL